MLLYKGIREDGKMDLHEIRDSIENKSTSIGQLGAILNDVLETHRAVDDYEIILKMVRDKILDYQTETEKLQRLINECKTIKDLSYFISNTNFGVYNSKGISISKMINKRMMELYNEKWNKETFWQKLRRFFCVIDE